MSNDQDEKQKKEKADKAVARLEAVRAVKQLSNDDSKWTLTQEILQEIMASFIVVDAKTMPSAPKLIELLKEEIEKRYEDQPETKQLLMDSVPSQPASVRAWFKKEGWEESVWTKIRTEQLFSSEKRAEVIESLRLRAIGKSDIAAKLWLTMSGDYQEKMEVNDKTIDTFREINSILHNKKNNT